MSRDTSRFRSRRNGQEFQRPRQSVKGFGVSNWAGIFVPKNTPKAIRDRLFSAFAEVSKLPEVRTLQNRAGIEVSLSKSIDEFSTSLRDETGRWAKIIKEADIKVQQ